MVIAIWVVTAILVGLWSLTAWGLHGLLLLAGGWAGDLQPLLDKIPHAGVIEAWFPGWQELLRLVLDLTQGALAWAGGAVPLLAWLVWGLGTGALLLVAGGLTLVVLLLRNSMPTPAPAA